MYILLYKKSGEHMTTLLQVIQVLQTELTQMLLKGYAASDPEVIKKSQEIDKLVTAYYKYEYTDRQAIISRCKKAK
jgi:hypothetical protein